jgi:ABC-2 type transport system permease protein
MSDLLNITKKELKGLITVGTLASVIVVVIVFMGVGSMLGGATEDITQPAKIGFVNDDPDGDWSDKTVEYLVTVYMLNYDLTEEEARSYIVLLDGHYDDYDLITDQMRELGLTTALGIGPDYSSNLDASIQGNISQYYVFKNEGMLGSATSSLAPSIIQMISHGISAELVSQIATPEETAFMLNPIRGASSHTYVNGEVYEGITPMDISTSLLGQTMMVPMIIMMIVMMIGSIVISSMGTEKENKTLETLLTLPVKRMTIVGGKLLASAIAGLIFGLLYLVGTMSYVGGMTGSVGGVDLASYGLKVEPLEWVLVGIMIFLAIFCALGLCMILGAFVKNMKTAQSMTLPIGVLAMIPMFVTMFTSWESLPFAVQAPLFAIPFTHPMMVIDNLMFGNTGLVFTGLAYLIVFSLVTVLITVRIYKSDILLTGIGQTKFMRFLSRKKSGE